MQMKNIVIFGLYLLLCNALWPAVEEPEIRFTGEANLSDWLVESIDAAESTIKVMVFIFEYEPILDALIRASNRGVDVEVVTDFRSTTILSVPSGGGSVPDQLITAGVDCYIYDDSLSIMHHKVVLIDKILFFGSYNFQDEATFANCENLIRVLDPVIYAGFMSEYKRVLGLCEMHVQRVGLGGRFEFLAQITPLWGEYRWFIAIALFLSLIANGTILLRFLMNRRGGQIDG
jgi:phosphatidylserine/phosphatidylglycerophosphate/cardiolipin synthase-like enzyme|tara:strand:+ start:2488 stop:3183 length:696 start_codon:yes stop_codon:yes gene_type:complete